MKLIRSREDRSYIRDPVETLPRAELEKLQIQRLQSGIDRVSKCVPFYRDKLRAAGVTAECIRSRADLARLPFTTKDDLRDQYPFGLVAVPKRELVRVHA